MDNKHCGKCKNCLRVEKTKGQMLAISAKLAQNIHGGVRHDDGTIAVWNDTLRDYPCWDTIKPKWTAIEVDETQYLGDTYVPKVKRFLTVYMFDRNEITRICSQVKHYYLKPLYVNVEFQDDVDETERESIQSDLTCEIGDPDYFLERDIEKMIADGTARVVEYGELGEDENEDSVREHWQGNCPL